MSNNKGKPTEKDKIKDLEKFREYPSGKDLTTDQGVKVSHTDDSLKAGERGPTLMEDFHLREKLTHFDHERIPERIVHARGAGAHGYFECYKSMTEYTKARFLEEAGKKTPVFVRFSTVVGSRGSADTARDPRGFAVKFYTEDGNYDLVGNNIPVFFIQDAVKFPDLIHATKPEPDNEIPQASTAHDTFYDFVVSTPETTNMVLWVLSDRGIPRSFRMMEGFSVNTFRFVNSKGEGRFIKFIWKPLLGVHSLVWDEAHKLGGINPDYHRSDLFDAIQRGDYPEYELYVQMIEEKDEHNFDFDILDPTKHWPEELVPVMKIGKLVLNRNPENFFAEVEQVAFHPGNVVQGIDFSNDPLLQGRLFSYLDTQLIRLGGPNFHEIPINKPLTPVHSNQRDGYHRMMINTGKTSYSPNSLGLNDPKPSHEEGYIHYTEKVDGKKIRDRSDKFKDHYGQARSFYNSMSSVEKQHIISAFQFEVGKVNSEDVRQKVVDQFTNVDKGLAVAIAEGVGVKPPLDGADSSKADYFPSFSMKDTIHDTIKGRRIAILAADGFNYEDLINVKEALEDAKATTNIISKYRGTIISADEKIIEADTNLQGASSLLFDAVYIPSGEKSVQTLLEEDKISEFINEAFKHYKTLASKGYGLELFQKAGINSYESDNSEVKTINGIVTAGDDAPLNDFIILFIKEIGLNRHWDR